MYLAPCRVSTTCSYSSYLQCSEPIQPKQNRDGLLPARKPTLRGPRGQQGDASGWFFLGLAGLASQYITILTDWSAKIHKLSTLILQP